MERLIDEIVAVQRDVDRLAFDEEYPHELGAPALPHQILCVERALGAPLPPSYRAFLERHNGWKDFTGDAAILSAEDYGSAWLKKRLDELNTLFYEVGENPFKRGAIPILLGEDARNMVALDPRTLRSNGEMDFISFDIVTEEARFEDFPSFLAHKLRVLREIVDMQTKGTFDEDEDAE